MITDIVVVRRPRRKTHLSYALGGIRIDTMCRLNVPVDDASGLLISMAGGATVRLVADLKREFNDDTCCANCTMIVGMLLLVMNNRDHGTWFA